MRQHFGRRREGEERQRREQFCVVLHGAREFQEHVRHGMAEEIKSVAQVEKEKKAAAKKISTAQPSETEAKERDRETCRSVGSAATRLVQHQVEKEREKLPRPPASQPGDVGQACMCGEEDLSMALVAPAGAAAGRRR